MKIQRQKAPPRAHNSKEEIPMLNDPHTSKPTSFRRFRRFLIPLAIVSLAVSGVAVSGRFPGPGTSAAIRETATDAPLVRVETIRGKVRPGETISSLLGHLLGPGEIHELADRCRSIYRLRDICAGSPYELTLENGAFKRFACDIDNDDQLVFSRNGEDISVSRQPIPYTEEVVTVGGTIESSLFEAMVKSGESEGLAVRLADIFAWDIDFFHDIQQGDTFEVVVERRYRDGKPAGNGRLLAARFTTRGELHQAFLFQDGDRKPGYYDENGRNLRKAFLRAPLSFSRISSGFNLRRKHPITHRIKAHPAIDYAAPIGTPIHTIGEGKVVFAAYKRYNGKCVKVRHPNGWVSMYNHMSRFGKDIHPGRRVSQGQVIGYVGSTGLSTGPHLDFRLYRNGTPVNPLKVKSPPARPVSRSNMAAFRNLVAERIAFLEKGREDATAMAPARGAGKVL